MYLHTQPDTASQWKCFEHKISFRQKLLIDIEELTSAQTSILHTHTLSYWWRDAVYTTQYTHLQALVMIRRAKRECHKKQI